MSATQQPASTTAPSIAEQAKPLLAHAAGYASHRTIGLGLRRGLIAALAERPEGASPEQLARQLGFDAFYVSVWCRSALAAGVCERADEGYRLAPHVDTLLLDEHSPAYVGGVFLVFEQRELFGRFEEVLDSGERLWWDETSPEWIAGVAGTGTPFYSRLVAGGLSRVPGLADRLAAGCRVVDTACGAGIGLLELARAHPACEIVGVDGDAYSIELARKRLADAGLSDRVSLQASPLEEMILDEPATLVINNIYQLLPRHAYDELLSRHGFTELGSTELTPVHALTWGRRR